MLRRRRVRKAIQAPRVLAGVLVCLAVWAWPSIAAQQRDESASRESVDASLRRAKTLIQHGEFVQAEAALNSYLLAHPGTSEAAFLRGYVLFRENQPAKSLDAYTHAASLATPRADDLKIVALDYVLLHDDASAIRWLQRSLDMNATDAETWYFFGRALFSQSRFGEAEHAFQQALRLEPGDIRARNNLGLVYEAENRPAEALLEYERAVARDRAFQAARDRALRAAPGPGSTGVEATNLQPTSAETGVQPYLNLGTLLILQNRTAEAVTDLREALAIDAACVACHLQLGRALAREGQPVAARTEVEMAVKLKPADAALHYELGLLYQRSGDTAAARAEMARSKELYGSHAAGAGVP